MKTLAITVLVLGASMVRAEQDLSLARPKAHPDIAEVQGVRVIHPLPRPVFATAPAVASIAGPTIHPQPRPAQMALKPVVAVTVAQKPVVAPVEQKPVVEPVAQKPTAPSKGALCQRADLKGKVLPPIRSKIAGCNVPEPVLVAQVGGVVLNPPATINCEEAQALSTWVKTGLQPAFQNTIIALNVVDSYACRPRNNVRGNPVSVHGLGQAIDISAFVTNTGRTYTVAQSYNAQIRAAQKAGCGIFHTILGPGSDGYHESHIHFDVAHHGGSDYCR